MSKNRGFTEEDARYLESLPGAKVIRVNLPGVIAPEPAKKPGGFFKPTAMVDQKARRWDSQTEARFGFICDQLQDEKRIIKWQYNEVRYRLADRTWYKPDFVLTLPDFRKVIVEVKGGYITEKAKERIKVFADQSTDPFFLAQYISGWNITRLYSRVSEHNRVPDIFEGV